MKVEAYYMVFLCGLADAVTTQFGLWLNLVETRILFAPFLATFLFFLVLMFLDWRRLGVREEWREVVKAGLVLVALSPVLNNLQVMFSSLL